MIICICARVSDKTIERCARSGQSFDDIQFEHGVGMQCGQCRNCAHDIWERCNGAGAVAHIREAAETAGV